MKRKKERNTLLRRKNLLYYCIIILYAYINCIKERKKEGILIYEPPHDRTNKMACGPSEDSDQPGHPPSLISFRCPHEENFGSNLPIERTSKTLIRLGACRGWTLVFAGRKDHFVDFVMRRLIYFRHTFAFKQKCSSWKEKVSMREYIL